MATTTRKFRPKKRNLANVYAVTVIDATLTTVAPTLNNTELTNIIANVVSPDRISNARTKFSKVNFFGNAQRFCTKSPLVLNELRIK